MADAKEVLSFAVELGDVLLRNGGEVYRVEDSILAILNSYEITDCDVYVITNGIFASANETSEDSCSMIRHVPLAPTHLGRIASINSLCRRVCSHELSIEDGWKELDSIKNMTSYSPKTLLLATGIGCGCFTYMFGGTPLDALLSGLVGFVLYLVLRALGKMNYSKTVTNVLASAFVSIFALVAFLSGLPVHYDKIIIGDIMPLVPGIALTTGIRDFVNGDYLSGTIRLIDALLTSFCIAVGVGIIITLVNIISGGALL